MFEYKFRVLEVVDAVHNLGSCFRAFLPCSKACFRALAVEEARILVVVPVPVPVATVETELNKMISIKRVKDRSSTLSEDLIL